MMEAGEKMGKFQCENCGAAMTIDDEQLTATCEYCDTKISIPDTMPEYTEAVFERKVDELEEMNEPKDPFQNTSKPKMALIVTLIIVGIILVTSFSIVICQFALTIGGSGSGGYSGEENAQYSWPVTGNAALLPKPPSSYGKIMSDSEAHFSAVIEDVSQEEFNTYVEECKAYGFDVASSESDSAYWAYNAEGYLLDVFYWQEYDELNIYLDGPEEMTELIWPTVGLGAELPVPVSEYGRVISDDSDGVYILVYVDSIAEFVAYVEDCKKHGFNVNHQFYSDSQISGWYEADHRKGYHLDISYNDWYYKKMEIRLDIEE